MSKPLKALFRTLPDGEPPEWIELIPGELKLKTRDNRVFRNEAPHAIVEAFRANRADLPVDYEHASELRAPEGLDAPAVGWVVDMEVRGAAVWAKIDWTDAGSKAVASKAYRYISPVFFTTDGNITQVTSVALTNNPALYVKALAARENTIMLKAIAKALSLTDDASESAILAEIEKHKASAEKPSIKKFVARAEHDKLIETCSQLRRELKEIKDGQEANAVETAVDAAIAEGKVVPAIRDSEVEYCRAIGLDKYAERLKHLPVVADAKETAARKAPETGAGKLTAEQKAMCARMGVSENDYLETLETEEAA